jgi:tetratricopeptide (TPR) repeat protein
MAPSDPDVTVCITAYRSGGMIIPTLRSVKAQTHANLRVAISVDGPHAETEAICQAEADDRFDIIVQPSQLGWVGNTNATLDRVVTPYFFILPHDDLLHERYIELLLRELVAHPEAVNAYSDVELFGPERRVTMTRTDLDGNFLARVGAFLNPRLTSWIPWRGLTRSSVLSAGLRMRDNEHGGYDSHLDYILGLLCFGPCWRVAETLYYHRDRSDEDSVRANFRTRNSQNHYAAVLQHSLENMETVSTVGIRGESDVRDRRIALQMLLIEFLNRDMAIHKSLGSSTIERFMLMAGDLIAGLHGLPPSAGNPDYRPSPGSALGKLTAKLRVVEAQDAISRKQFGRAEAAVASALELDPNNGEAHWQNAVVLRRGGRIAEATTEARKARELSPSNPHILLLLANLLKRAGDPEAAIEEANAALALRPGWGQAYHDLSTYLEACGRYPEALAAAARASEANPSRFRSVYESLRQRTVDGDPSAASD